MNKYYVHTETLQSLSTEDLITMIRTRDEELARLNEVLAAYIAKFTKFSDCLAEILGDKLK